MMVRAHVYLEEEHYEQLRREASRQEISLSELIRRLIKEELCHSPAKRAHHKRVEKALGFVGKGRDSQRNVAREHDRYLAGL
jgi:predicted CopG family antitoxin